MAGNTGMGRKANTGASVVNNAGAQGRKRGRPAKVTLKTDGGGVKECRDGEEKNQESKVSPEPEDDRHGEDETPLKKTKFGDIVDSEATKSMLTSSPKT